MSRHLMGEKIEGLPEPAIDGAASPATSGSEPSAAFTPGPWDIGEALYDPLVDKTQRTLRAGATILGELDAWRADYAAESLANARLIVAAPDQHEALRRIVREAEEAPPSAADPFIVAILDIARAALARSGG